jgi:uncharacterized protein involved in outer membrane biogenesis
MTGLNLTIRSMSVGVLKSAVGINGLRLHNPSGFPDPVMVDLPEMYVDYDLGAFVGGKVHLEEVRLNLKEFIVVKDAQGRVNLDALKVVQESKGAPAEKPQPAAHAPQMQIDVLQLKVGKVIFKDYSKGGEPSVQEFPLNLDERYEHITNPQMLAGLIVSRALMNTTVAKLTGVDLTAVQAQVGEQMKQATELVAGTAKDAADVGKAAFGTAKDSVQKTADTLKKALPFGN